MKTLIFFLTLSTLSFTPEIIQGQSVTIVDFVTKSYIHGVPFSEAKSFGSQALPELFSMLHSPRYEKYRSNIVAIIGMIGDESAFVPLKEYLESQEGEISQATFISLLVVFQSLGRLGQNGNMNVIAYLAQWTRPNYWEKAGLKFTYQNYRDQTLGEVLGRLAIQGLGITGNPKAIEVLENLMNHEKQLKKNFNWDWSDNIEEAIALNKRISKEGVQKVFDESDQY